jgi:hypothetical protein
MDRTIQQQMTNARAVHPEPITAVIHGGQMMFLDCPAYLD